MFKSILGAVYANITSANTKLCVQPHVGKVGGRCASFTRILGTLPFMLLPEIVVERSLDERRPCLMKPFLRSLTQSSRAHSGNWLLCSRAPAGYKSSSSSSSSDEEEMVASINTMKVKCPSINICNLNWPFFRARCEVHCYND